MEIPAFVIHHPSAKDREDCVIDLQAKTGAFVSEAIWFEEKNKRHIGCTLSHIVVANTAKKILPDNYYLVFEDDCILSDNWTEILTNFQDYDIVYLGYTDICEHTIFGTHGLLISPKARDIIIEHALEYKDKVLHEGACDQILTKLIRDYKLKFKLPSYSRRQEFAHQKKGLVSQISGNLRK